MKNTLAVGTKVTVVEYLGLSRVQWQGMIVRDLSQAGFYGVSDGCGNTRSVRPYELTPVAA